MAEIQRLYLEDLQAGQSFMIGTYSLDEAAIRAFALAFDPQPTHLDPKAAQDSTFGGLAASGWHTRLQSPCAFW